MEEFWNSAVRIAVLLNPCAVLSTFIALTISRKPRERFFILCRTCGTVIAAGIAVLFSGELIFRLLGIDLNVFKAGGGVVLMICSISLVRGRETKIADPGGSDISVVPLAIPMALGPGTAAGLMVIGSGKSADLAGAISAIGSLCAGVFVLACILSFGICSEKLLNRTALSIVTRLTGLFLSAIAAKMILDGAGKALNAVL